MVQAIIFDCFGVLTHDGWLPFKRKYFKDKPEKLQEATDLGVRVNTGHLSYESFINRLAGMANVKNAVAQKAMHSNIPNDELLAYIRDKLHGRYKLGLLSNTG